MGNDDDRDAILRRRRRFVALALSGIATTGAAGGCYESHELGTEAVDASPDTSVSPPTPCLEAPMPCLSAPAPCLGALPDDAGSPVDAAPTPCLDFAPMDAGPDEDEA